MYDKLKKELEQLPCHFTWNFDPKKFEERRQMNLESCQEHLESTPEEPSILNFLAYLYASVKEYDKATELLTKCRATNPDDPICIANLAHIYFKKDQYAKTRDMLAAYKVLVENPDKKIMPEGLSHWSRAYAHVRLFEYQEARVIYQLAWDKLQCHELLVYKAMLFNRDKQFRAALETIETLRAKNYNSVLMKIQLGRALTGLNRRDEAISVFNAAYQEAPDNEALLRFYAKSIQCLDDASALKLLEQSINQRPTTYAYHCCAQIYLHTKNKKINSPQKGEKYLENAVKLCPGNYQAAFELIKRYLKSKKSTPHQKAIKICEDLKTSGANIPLVQLYYYWGMCHLKLDDKEEAEAKLRISLRGDYSEFVGQHKFDRICQRNSASELVKLLEEKFSENDSSYWEGIGEIQVKSGGREQAKKFCEKGLRLFPTSVRLHAALARVLSILKQHEQSIIFFKSAFYFHHQNKQTKEMEFVLDRLSGIYLKKANDAQEKLENQITACLSFFKFKLDMSRMGSMFLTFIRYYTDFTERNTSFLLTNFVVASFFLSKLEKSDDEQAKLASLLIYQKIGFIEEIKRLSEELDNTEGKESAKKLERLGEALAFDQENPKQLIVMRACCLRFINAWLHDCPSQKNLDELRRLATQLICESRKMLDFIFIKFVKQHFPHFKEGAAALFPCVPAPKPGDNKGVKERLTNYLESGKGSFLGLKNFTQQFPSIFNFLLSIQPLQNPQYSWLKELYKLRNTAAHENVALPELYEIDGKFVNTIQFAFYCYVHVEQLSVNFYQAHCKDIQSPEDNVNNYTTLPDKDCLIFYLSIIQNIRSIAQAQQLDPADRLEKINFDFFSQQKVQPQASAVLRDIIASQFQPL